MVPCTSTWRYHYVYIIQPKFNLIPGFHVPSQHCRIATSTLHYLHPHIYRPTIPRRTGTNPSQDWNQSLAGLEPIPRRTGTNPSQDWNQSLAGLEPIPRRTGTNPSQDWDRVGFLHQSHAETISYQLQYVVPSMMLYGNQAIEWMKFPQIVTFHQQKYKTATLIFSTH